MDQLFFSETNQGLRITYGGETLLLIGSDGITLTPSMLQESDLLGTSRLPQTIVAGFAGPVVTPALPDQPVITTSDPPILQEEQGLDLRGTGWNNYLKGADTDDTLWGLAGNDALYGFEGDDQLFGGSGADAIYGSVGHDILLGGSGRDTNWTDGTSTQTQDTLIGGQGGDQLFGQSGVDPLSGEQGNDRLTGGGGRDTFVFSAGRDHLTYFSKQVDRLQIDYALWVGTKFTAQIVSAYATVSGQDVVFDFGGGNVLVLEDTTSTAGLSNLIYIVE